MELYCKSKNLQSQFSQFCQNQMDYFINKVVLFSPTLCVGVIWAHRNLFKITEIKFYIFGGFLIVVPIGLEKCGETPETSL